MATFCGDRGQTGLFAPDRVAEASRKDTDGVIAGLVSNSEII